MGILVSSFQEMYGADISPSLISRVTDAVMDEVIEFLEKQPEYIEAGDKGKKTPSLLQSKMQAELQATIAFRPSREVAQNLSKLKNRARAMEKIGSEIRLHLFDINITSGSFSAVRSFSQGHSNGINFVGNISDASALRFDIGNNGLVFKLPYNAYVRTSSYIFRTIQVPQSKFGLGYCPLFYFT